MNNLVSPYDIHSLNVYKILHQSPVLGKDFSPMKIIPKAKFHMTKPNIKQNE